MEDNDYGGGGHPRWIAALQTSAQVVEERRRRNVREEGRGEGRDGRERVSIGMGKMGHVRVGGEIFVVGSMVWDLKDISIWNHVPVY